MAGRRGSKLAWRRSPIHQGGYAFVVVCLFVSLLAILRKNFQKWASEQMIKFWRRSGSPSGLFSGFVTIGRYGKWYQTTALRDAAVHGMQQQLAGIAISTVTSLRHRPMAEICTVTVLLVSNGVGVSNKI